VASDLQGIQNAYEAVADLVVIGTAFENDIHFFLIRIRNTKI
jgi:putative glycerol-1-phosphate prenyltransferase